MPLRPLRRNAPAGWLAALGVLALVGGSTSLARRAEAADAAPTLRTSVASGSHYVKPLQTYVYTIKARNAGTTTAVKPTFMIAGVDTPLDFKSIEIVGDTHGFRCFIQQRLAIVGAHAQCSHDVSMPPGLEITIRLRTATGVLVPGTGELRISSVANANGSRPTLHTTAYAIYAVY